MLEGDIPEAPVVETADITRVTRNRAIAGGTVISDGGTNVLAGVCWSTDSIPTVSNSRCTIDRIGTEIGVFCSYIPNDQTNTKLFVRAFAANTKYVSYGEIKEFVTADSSNIAVYGEEVTDIDGNIYQTVIIDTITWMAENLKTGTLCDGTPIAYVEDTALWCSTTSPAYCFYGQDTLNKEIFGALYNYYTVNTDLLCPTGWHVATDEEWLSLAYYTPAGELSGAGLYLKSQSSLWATNTNGKPGIDIYGFNGVPGGYRRGPTSSSFGTFTAFYNNSVFWPKSAMSESGSVTRYWLNNTNHNMLRSFTSDLNIGYSVRCVKNRGE